MHTSVESLCNERDMGLMISFWFTVGLTVEYGRMGRSDLYRSLHDGQMEDDCAGFCFSVLETNDSEVKVPCTLGNMGGAFDSYFTTVTSDLAFAFFSGSSGQAYQVKKSENQLLRCCMVSGTHRQAVVYDREESFGLFGAVDIARETVHQRGSFISIIRRALRPLEWNIY